MEEELKEITEELLKKFEEKISNDTDKQELIDAFKNYIESSKKQIQESGISLTEENREIIKSILNRVSNRIYQKDINNIKHEFLRDEIYQSLRNKSIDIFEDARLKARNGLKNNKYNTEEEIKNIEKMLKEVKPYNMEYAKKLASEAIIDLQFIEKENPKLASLRIARFIKDIGGKAMEQKYLPIGTVVMLKGATKRIMITGFCTAGSDDVVWDYSGCLYPEGILNANQIALFNHSQIEKVYHLGLVDDEEENFKEQLKEALSKEQTEKVNNKFSNLYVEKRK